MSRTFEDTVLPHLDAAFNYARWLTRNDAEAEDLVQDACVRAMRFFTTFRNDNARAWLFTIVRNTWFSRAPRQANATRAVAFETAQLVLLDGGLGPEEQLLQQHAIARVRGALERLPSDFREVLVLREIQELSYKEIAAVLELPMGTVMSRLARARERLLEVLSLSEDRETLP